MSNTDNEGGRHERRDHRQCWDCGGETFKLFSKDSLVRAECVDCGGTLLPAQLYVPEARAREKYKMEMNHD